MKKKTKKEKVVSVKGELSKLIKKEFEKKVKAEAKGKLERIKSERLRLERERDIRKKPITTSLEQVRTQTQQAQQTRRKFRVMGSIAEQLEIQAINLDEIPLLQDMEEERTRKTMVSSKALMNMEKPITDSFPQ
jgi:hypothetical protein